MMLVIDYEQPGPLTDLGDLDAAVLDSIPRDPIGICAVVPDLVIHPIDAEARGIPAERFGENQLRSATSIIQAVLALDPAPLRVPRDPASRVIGTCRNFVVLSCALLRQRGIAARARCGFGTYFEVGLGLDHWITEYWHDVDNRWVRVDTQHLSNSFVAHPEDLRPGEFLTGGEAWTLCRQDRIDAAAFGVGGTKNFGPGEIRGNAIRDLAALNKVEMLPWDEWGRMTASYRGETGADYDELIDTIARVCAADEPLALAGLYASQDLQVPPVLIC